MPAARGVDDDDRFAGVVVNAKIVGDDSVFGVTPAVDGLAVALDDVANDFVTVEIKIRFECSLAGFHVIVVTLYILQQASV